MNPNLNLNQHSLSLVRNYVFPTPDRPLTGTYAPGDNRDLSNTKRDLRNYISPVQLLRIRHDIALWRAAVDEAERAWFPHRVRMQRMYIDTILSGHTEACILKRKDLTLLRSWSFKNEKEEHNENQKKLFNKPWFRLFLEYALEARFFGYSLITLGNVVNNGFPDLGIIRRFNISPDRLNVTNLIYSITGEQFMEEPFSTWHVWVPTPSNVGVSKVGYGELYSVANYEILARNLLGSNADAADLYGVPVRHAKTTKTDDAERTDLEMALANMGGKGYIMTDPTDEVDLIESKGNGQGFKIFPDFESRLEKKISKLLLGHADALDSVPGKLGASQGHKKSPAEVAMIDKQTNDGNFLEAVVNDNLIPKLINLGFVIDTDYKFCFDNNQEKMELRQNEDANNLVLANVAKQMSDSGMQMDPLYFQERTGIKTTKKEIPITSLNETRNALRRSYYKK